MTWTFYQILVPNPITNPNSFVSLSLLSTTNHKNPPPAVSPKATHNRKPPPNRPLPPPLPPLPLSKPRSLDALPLRLRPCPSHLLRCCSPRNHENPQPYLLQPAQIHNNGQIIVRLQGPRFKSLRSICILQLLSNKRVQLFRNIREEETANMIEKIRSSGSDVVNLSELIVELTGDVVCRAALGSKYGGVGGEGRGRGFKEVMGEFAELLGVFKG
ncbi:hypothetical protein Vadar_013628 [Vaccinium darrowii]|nr:hypothetical protein Vadar_013628 [Vaccinium darrowii]